MTTWLQEVEAQHGSPDAFAARAPEINLWNDQAHWIWHLGDPEVPSSVEVEVDRHEDNWELWVVRVEDDSGFRVVLESYDPPTDDDMRALCRLAGLLPPLESRTEWGVAHQPTAEGFSLTAHEFEAEARRIAARVSVSTVATRNVYSTPWRCAPEPTTTEGEATR